MSCKLFFYLFFCPSRYSFRMPPRLDLHVRPMLGEREVTFTHVTEWIEKKLQCEFQVSLSTNPFKFKSKSSQQHNSYTGRLLNITLLFFFFVAHQKVFVMPNMDDLYLPLMTSGLENPPASHHSSVQSTSQQSSMESQEYLSE